MTCAPGYPCEPHNNPADFFLDVINGDFTATTMTKMHGCEGNGIYFTAPLESRLMSLDLSLYEWLDFFWRSWKYCCDRQRRFWRILSCWTRDKIQVQPVRHLDGEVPLKVAQFSLLSFINISLYLLTQKVFLSPSYLISVSNRSCFCVAQFNKVIKYKYVYIRHKRHSDKI